MPVFLVDDVRLTAEYYRDVLGFEVDFLYGEPPTYASVSRDDADHRLQHAANPPGARNSVKVSGVERTAPTRYIVVSDVEEIYDRDPEKGANVIEKLAPTHTSTASSSS